MMARLVLAVVATAAMAAPAAAAEKIVKASAGIWRTRARSINPNVWTFPRTHALSADPVFVRYDIR